MVLCNVSLTYAVTLMNTRAASSCNTNNLINSVRGWATWARRAVSLKRKQEAVNCKNIRADEKLLYVRAVHISEHWDTRTSFPVAHQSLHFNLESKYKSRHLALVFNSCTRWCFSSISIKDTLSTQSRLPHETRIRSAVFVFSLRPEWMKGADPWSLLCFCSSIRVFLFVFLVPFLFCFFNTARSGLK